MIVRALLSVAVAVVALAATGCGTRGQDLAAGQQPPSSGLHVVATTSILGDIVTNVVGDAATVEVVLPAGTDPHDFSPSASQVAMLTEADLVVANGLHLEEGLIDALDSAQADGGRVFEMASAFPPQPAAGDHGAGDPHIWFDPPQMAEAVLALGEELAAVDDAASAEQWRQRAGAYHDAILATDADIVELLGGIPEADRTLVTNHHTLDRFAERYGFEVVGAAIPSTSSTAQSSAAELAELAEVIRQQDVPAVFSENVSDDSLMRTLAAEAGRDVAVVPMLTDSLAPQGEEGDTYLSMLQINARRIAEALS